MSRTHPLPTAQTEKMAAIILGGLLLVAAFGAVLYVLARYLPLD